MECIIMDVVCCVKAVMLIWGAKRPLLHNNVQAQHTRFCDALRLWKACKNWGTNHRAEFHQLLPKVGRARKTLDSIIGSF
jgi:hypothetical protein